MRRVWVVLLAVVFMAVGFAAQDKPADEKKAAAKEDQWDGIIVMHSKEKSTVTVSNMGFEKTVVYDSSTKWTRGGKPADPKEFSDGTRVVCHGKYDKKGRLVASHIDRPR